MIVISELALERKREIRMAGIDTEMKLLRIMDQVGFEHSWSLSAAAVIK